MLKLTVAGGQASRLDQLARALEAEPKALLDGTLDILTFFALRSSNGSMTLKMMALADHPFATRHGTVPDHAGIINNQTGVLLSSWRRRAWTTKGYVFNVSKEAAFLDTGTVNMVRRPLPELVLDVSQGRIHQMLISHERRLVALLR